MPIHNRRLRELIKPSYGRDDLLQIARFFEQHGTLQLKIKDNGLYAAITTDAKESESGYTHTWVRDTVMVTNYQRELGEDAIAARTITTLNRFFDKYRSRFTDIIEGHADKQDDMRRPHIRFDGDALVEVDQKWAHAQNDALGYAMWMTFRLANEHAYVLSETDRRVYALFPVYFEEIEYWQDADSGHWEETPKVESSSIGVVIAALREMQIYLHNHPAVEFRYGGRQVSLDTLDELIRKGQQQLDRFLPHESPPLREADAALLFLIYPLEVAGGERAQGILDNVLENLLGDHGIKRYQGDSYWCAEYKSYMEAVKLSSDFSDETEWRDQFLTPGTEAQWCLFDPIISVIYGRRYLASRNPEDLRRQIHHFNRSLAQLTAEDHALGGGQCPEAYYIEALSDQRYVPNDNAPLAWTQANLGIAFEYMRQTVAAPR